MLKVEIPGFKTLELKHLVMDYNGTLAVDGELESGVKELLTELSDQLQIHILTADTFGKVTGAFAEDPYQVTILGAGEQCFAKLEYIQKLGAGSCVAIGNGRNDQLMLREAGLGLAVLLGEGLARETMLCADVVTLGIIPALELLLHPLRLVASLRS